MAYTQLLNDLDSWPALLMFALFAHDLGKIVALKRDVNHGLQVNQ